MFAFPRTRRAVEGEAERKMPRFSRWKETRVRLAGFPSFSPDDRESGPGSVCRESLVNNESERGRAASFQRAEWP